jgi:hypothetical protein
VRATPGTAIATSGSGEAILNIHAEAPGSARATRLSDQGKRSQDMKSKL